MTIIIPKWHNWDFKSVHKELEENKKRFGLVWHQNFEWGMGMGLVLADTMEEVRDLMLKTTNGKYPCRLMDGKEVLTDDFHSMKFEIYKSHHYGIQP